MIVILLLYSQYRLTLDDAINIFRELVIAYVSEYW